ncbi:colanic acid biosynthesis glycosyl transferase WcaI [Thermotomaculum hydrothermale]|uniref:Colanic acid biosynthesis glycosyl transferase WcaI n=1 Tax=Thermotomaculum hydrothermale TaxID=981385 RepID=A0A7R6PGM0_9BACT|nr:WcaI family glycosyltransferase [Thermotomaculum hydrothermale]BBB33408.1 colanic acid biosynthesis glycosyl transferase WcaI [Thermotomaculum hydrothermale]
MKKKITIISINFYPEDTSTGLYTSQMAEFLSENGFEVSVITGFPYYPQWEIWEDYKSKGSYLEEDHKTIKIYRFKQYTPSNPSFLKRIRQILSFTFGSFKNLRKIKETDLVIAIVPFTSNIYLAQKLAKRKKAKVWTHIQDFEFDAAFESGVIKGKFVQKIMSKVLYFVESSLLNKSNIVSTISFSMIEKAKRKTKSEIYYFPNWIDENFVNPEESKPHRYLNGDKFKLLYSGNIGAKQDWESFLRFVELIKDREDMEVVVVGDGARKDWLVSKLENYSNVKYYPPVPYEELPDLLCSADLHLLFQKDSVVDTVMPSKLLGMMASARPSLVTGNKNSEVAKILNESQGGAFFSPQDFDEILNFVEKMKNDKSLRTQYGLNARKYIIENFSKTKVLNGLKEKINSILSD